MEVTEQQSNKVPKCQSKTGLNERFLCHILEAIIPNGVKCFVTLLLCGFATFNNYKFRFIEDIASLITLQYLQYLQYLQ
jgi:hypothetical protein